MVVESTPSNRAFYKAVSGVDFDYIETWRWCPNRQRLELDSHAYVFGLHRPVSLKLKKFRHLSGSYTFEPGSGLPGVAYRSNQVCVINDVQQHPLYHRKEESKECNLVSAIAVPVLLQHQPVAIVVAYNIRKSGELFDASLAPSVKVDSSHLANTCPLVLLVTGEHGYCDPNLRNNPFIQQTRELWAQLVDSSFKNDDGLADDMQSVQVQSCSGLQPQETMPCGNNQNCLATKVVSLAEAFEMIYVHMPNKLKTWFLIGLGMVCCTWRGIVQDVEWIKMIDHVRHAPPIETLQQLSSLAKSAWASVVIAMDITQLTDDAKDVTLTLLPMFQQLCTLSLSASGYSFICLLKMLKSCSRVKCVNLTHSCHVFKHGKWTQMMEHRLHWMLQNRGGGGRLVSHCCDQQCGVCKDRLWGFIECSRCRSQFCCNCSYCWSCSSCGAELCNGCKGSSYELQLCESCGPPYPRTKEETINEPKAKRTKKK